MAELYDAIQREIAKYPDRRGAILPALHLAQEHYGWLPPEAFEAVGEALDLSPAHCLSVASFYDMFFLQPVGDHVVEVCTNLSCALVGQAPPAASPPPPAASPTPKISTPGRNMSRRASASSASRNARGVPANR